MSNPSHSFELSPVHPEPKYLLEGGKQLGDIDGEREERTIQRGVGDQHDALLFKQHTVDRRGNIQDGQLGIPDHQRRRHTVGRSQEHEKNVGKDLAFG